MWVVLSVRRLWGACLVPRAVSVCRFVWSGVGGGRSNHSAVLKLISLQSCVRAAAGRFRRCRAHRQAAMDDAFATAWPRTRLAADAIVAAADEAAATSAVARLSAEEASATPEDGISLLMLASAAGFTQCCMSLIAAGVPLEGRDAFGCDALFYAVRHQKLDIVDLLLVSKAPIDAFGKAGGSSLIEAATLGDARLASLLCAANADVDAQDAFGDSAVKAALRTSSWEVLLVLVRIVAEKTRSP